MARTKVISICFYCKKVVTKNTKECCNCNRPSRHIKLEVIRERLSPWYKLFNVKYSYTVLNERFKFVELQLNK